MPTTIDQYREAKATYQKLHNQAKKELLARFNELSNELLQVQKELRDDFHVKVQIPTKPKAGSRAAKAVKQAPISNAEPALPNPAIARTEKKLALQKSKLEEAVKAGRDAKPIKDRIYELEDELRLAKA